MPDPDVAPQPAPADAVAGVMHLREPRSTHRIAGAGQQARWVETAEVVIHPR